MSIPNSFVEYSLARTRSIIACLRCSTDPCRITFPWESLLSSGTNGSDSPAVELVVFFGEDVKPGNPSAEAPENMLADGRRVDAGRCGSDRIGIGGIEDRVEPSDVDGVGMPVLCTFGCGLATIYRSMFPGTFAQPA